MCYDYKTNKLLPETGAMVEARPPSVPQDKDGNPFCGKGEAAEDSFLFPEDTFLGRRRKCGGLSQIVERYH